MLATCTDGLIGIRDRALLLFAFASGARRRSEVAGAVMENLVKINAQTYLYRLTHSKTDQAGTANRGRLIFASKSDGRKHPLFPGVFDPTRVSSRFYCCSCYP
jgi:integrase